MSHITIFDDRVEVKKEVFTITVKPVDGKTLDDCIARGHELLKHAGIANYKVEDKRDMI